MHVDSQFVEQIVTAVLDRLQRRTDNPRATHAAPAPAAAHDEIPVLNVPVLTAAMLEEQFASSGPAAPRRLQIGSKTVLTPSARDFLRIKHIDWTRGTAGKTDAATASRWQALAVSATNALRSLCERPSSDMGLTASRWLGSTDEAVEQATSALARGEVHGIVVFTTQTARAVCRANRQAAVRAATAGNRGDVDAARLQMGANLFVISPAGKSEFELRTLVRAATSGGVPRVPADWKP